MFLILEGSLQSREPPPMVPAYAAGGSLYRLPPAQSYLQFSGLSGSPTLILLSSAWTSVPSS